MNWISVLNLLLFLKMNDLASLPNLGKEIVQRLNQVGIYSAAELIAFGTENVFLRLQASDPGACFCLLCGLEGAIQGIRWHNLSSERKLELKHFLELSRKKINILTTDYISRK